MDPASSANSLAQKGKFVSGIAVTFKQNNNAADTHYIVWTPWFVLYTIIKG
jgi:hypothetical protein